MVILGGLELIAAGYLIAQHEKRKQEQERLEEIKNGIKSEKKSRRKHYEPPRHERSSRRDSRRKHDHGPRDRPSSSAPPSSKPASKPSAPGGRLTVQNLSPPVPVSIPMGPQRPSSQPPPEYRPPAVYTSPTMMGHGPYSQPPPPSPYSGLYSSSYPPSSSAFLTPTPPPSAPQPAPQQEQLYATDEKFTYNPEVDDPRRRSDSSLPLGIYEPPGGVYELSADGPWMSDQHLTVHQRPHVRFNLPDHGIVSPTDPRSPPPAYRP